MSASTRSAVVQVVFRALSVATDKVHDHRLASEIERESLARLINHDVRAITTSFMVLTCYLYMQSSYLTSSIALTCYGVLLVPAVIRRLFVTGYLRHWAHQPEIKRYLGFYRLTILCSGAAWGIISLLTFMPDNLISQSMNAITLAGIVGGACISYSVDKRTMASFFIGALLIGLPVYFIQPQGGAVGLNQSAMIGVLMVLFSGFVMLASLNVANFLGEFIQLRLIEKQDKDQIKTLLEKQKLHMDYTPLGVVEWLPDGTVTSWNVAAAKIFGFESWEMVGQPLSKLFPEDALTDLRINTDQLLVDVGGTYLKSTNLTKGQIEIFCEWFNTAIFDANGNVISIASMVQDETAFVRAQQEVQHLAYYDALTSLPNRRMLMDRLRQVRGGCDRSKQFSGLMFIDLDNFKEVNDAYGHDVGDELLINISQRLQHVVRVGDTVARMGGDEFVILLADLGHDQLKAIEACTGIANKIVDVLSLPFEFKQFCYPVTASLGLSLIHSGMGSAEDILRHADQAMYEAKAAGRNCLRFYEESLEQILDRKAMLKMALVGALQREQFVVFLQPQMAHQTLIGGEALLRWSHPDLGMISPAEFIPLAEETGVIVSVGYWVLEQVCTLLQAWHAEGGCYISLAVNVSVIQFAQADFVERMKDILQRHHFPPHMLKLELTESLMIQNVDEIVCKMHALKTLGICLSLDDFGTGYSSLSVLKKLPLDELKIDRIFVQDILQNSESAAIAETIIAMGNKLNLSIIAEGVETAEQVQYLQSLGCHKFQGFLYGKPCAIEDFNRLKA